MRIRVDESLRSKLGGEIVEVVNGLISLPSMETLELTWLNPKLYEIMPDEPFEVFTARYNEILPDGARVHQRKDRCRQLWDAGCRFIVLDQESSLLCGEIEDIVNGTFKTVPSGKLASQLFAKGWRKIDG